MYLNVLGCFFNRKQIEKEIRCGKLLPIDSSVLQPSTVENKIIYIILNNNSVHKCDHCHRTFNKQEHLRRRIKTQTCILKYKMLI